MRASVAALAQVGIQAPRLEFPLHLPSRQPHQDSLRVRFLFAVYIAWPLLRVDHVVHFGKFGVHWCVPASSGEKGYQAGKKPATCRSCGKTLLRANVTLSDFLPGRGYGNSQTVSPALSRRSSWVSWSDSAHEQSVPSGEDAIMEDCTESHQSEINRTIKAERQTAETSHVYAGRRQCLFAETVLGRKMQSMDDEKAALLAAKRQILPLQCRNEKNRKLNCSESRKVSKRNSQTRLEILQKRIETDQELESANAKQIQAKQEMASLVAEQAAENCQSCKPRVSRDPTTSDRLHVRQIGTTNHPLGVQVCPRDAKQMLQQCVGTAHGDWSDGRRCQESQPDYGTHSASAGRRDHASRAWPRGAQAPVRGSVYRRPVLCWKTCLASAAWTSRARNPSREACETRTPKRDVRQRNVIKEEEGSSLLRQWFWTVLTATFLYLALSKLVKRITLALFSLQQSCMTPSAMKLASGPRI